MGFAVHSSQPGFIPTYRNEFSAPEWAAENRFAWSLFAECRARASIYETRDLYRGQFRASHAELALRCGESLWRVRRALGMLVQAGYLRRATGQPRRGAALVWEVVGFDRWCRTPDRPWVAPESIPGRPVKVAEGVGRGVAQSRREVAAAGPTPSSAPTNSPSNFARTLNQQEDLAESAKLADRPSNSPSNFADPFLYIGKEDLTTTTTARARDPEAPPAPAVVVVVDPPLEGEGPQGPQSAPAEVGSPQEDAPAAPQEAPGSLEDSQEGEDTPPARQLAVAPAPAPDATDELVQQLIDLWNRCRYRETGAQLEGPVCKTTRAHRGQWKDLRDAVVAQPDLGEWEMLFLTIAGTKLLRGEMKSGWQASLQWSLKPDNRAKVWSGQYGFSMLVQKPSINTSQNRIPVTQPEPIPEAAHGKVDEEAPKAIPRRVTLGDWRAMLRDVDAPR